MKQKFRKRPYLIPLFMIMGVAALALFGWLVMLLWNAAIVPATGAHIIGIWQAMGLLLLSRILVGGFRGRRWGHRHGMREKWMSMSAEEKETFMSNCRMRWGRQFPKPEETAAE